MHDLLGDLFSAKNAGVTRAAPQLPREIPARGSLEEGVHNLGLRHAWELRAALGEAPYEVSERLAGLLGARAQVPGIPRVHVRALEVAHERADQIIPVVDLAGRCSSHVRAESPRCRGRLQMMTSSLVAPPS
jgi:hypothetical protein